MQRVHHSTANLTPVPLEPTSGSPGFFREGSPLIAPTFVTGNWANGIQEELIYIIQQGGLTPNINVNTQVFDALRNSNDGRYVNVTGDTMTGFLTLNAPPTANLHAATKQYVDTLPFVKIAGDTMTGILNMGTNRITSLGIPVSLGDAVRLEDAVLIAGDSGPLGFHQMTGFLTLVAPPVSALHAATKQYVDTAISGVAAGAPILLTGLTFVPSPSFPIISSIASSTAAVTKNSSSVAIPGVPAGTQYLFVRTKFNINIEDNISVHMFINASGTGFVERVSMDPIQGGSSSSFEAEDYSTMIVPFNPSVNTYQTRATRNNSGTGWVANVTHFLEGFFIADSTGGLTLPQADARYVNIPGDTMTGFLTLNANPTASLHAATKSYVDTAVAGGSSGLSGTFVNATGSRSLSTTFTNSFGNDILVIVSVFQGGGDLRGFVNGLEVVVESGSGHRFLAFVVDSGASYSVVAAGVAPTIFHWYEYR